MIARLTPCRREVELTGPHYAARFPLDRLPMWCAFYRRLRDRCGGKYAHHYTDTVAALEAVAAELERPE